MPDHQDDPATVTVPLKDLPFYATMVDALIERCQGLLEAAYKHTITEEKIEGITDITDRIITVSRWLAAQSPAGVALADQSTEAASVPSGRSVGQLP